MCSYYLIKTDKNIWNPSSYNVLLSVTIEWDLCLKKMSKLKKKKTSANSKLAKLLSPAPQVFILQNICKGKNCRELKLLENKFIFIILYKLNQMFVQHFFYWIKYFSSQQNNVPLTYIGYFLYMGWQHEQQ